VTVNDTERAAKAEQTELNRRMVVMSAESTVAEVRIAELADRQRAAWRRHRAAKGLVTRALKDGNAERIAAAGARAGGSALRNGPGPGRFRHGPGASAPGSGRVTERVPAGEGSAARGALLTFPVLGRSSVPSWHGPCDS